MPDFPENIDELLNDLKQLRDELKLQIHLGKAEAKDEWDKLEEKWQDLKDRSRDIGEATDESAQDVGTAMELVVDELKKGYERIRKLL